MKTKMKTTEKKPNTKALKTIDASGKTLGRVASEIAMSLMGKTSPSFERNKFSGFPVKVVNASKLRITPRKLEEIFHTRYSGYPGGLRVLTGTEISEKRGMKEVIKLSVEGMLPKNKLKREMMKNLVVQD